MLDKLVKKIVTDGVEALVVYPDWPRRRFYKRLQELADGVMYWPAGVSFFELKDQKVRPTKWGVWVAYLKRRVDSCEGDERWSSRSKKRWLRRIKLRNSTRSVDPADTIWPVDG
jgi:hypothetical protein